MNENSYNTSDFNEDISKIENECIYCKKIPYQIIHLTCNHNFCLDCALKKMPKEKNKIPFLFICEFCKKPTYLSQGLKNILDDLLNRKHKILPNSNEKRLNVSFKKQNKPDQIVFKIEKIEDSINKKNNELYINDDYQKNYEDNKKYCEDINNFGNNNNYDEKVFLKKNNLEENNNGIDFENNQDYKYLSESNLFYKNENKNEKKDEIEKFEEPKLKLTTILEDIEISYSQESSSYEKNSLIKSRNFFTHIDNKINGKNSIKIEERNLKLNRSLKKKINLKNILKNLQNNNKILFKKSFKKSMDKKKVKKKSKQRIFKSYDKDKKISKSNEKNNKRIFQSEIFRTEQSISSDKKKIKKKKFIRHPKKEIFIKDKNFCENCVLEKMKKNIKLIKSNKVYSKEIIKEIKNEMATGKKMIKNFKEKKNILKDYIKEKSKTMKKKFLIFYNQLILLIEKEKIRFEDELKKNEEKILKDFKKEEKKIQERICYYNNLIKKVNTQNFLSNYLKKKNSIEKKFGDKNINISLFFKKKMKNLSSFFKNEYSTSINNFFEKIQNSSNSVFSHDFFPNFKEINFESFNKIFCLKKNELRNVLSRRSFKKCNHTSFINKKKKNVMKKSLLIKKKKKFTKNIKIFG